MPRNVGMGVESSERNNCTSTGNSPASLYNNSIYASKSRPRRGGSTGDLDVDTTAFLKMGSTSSSRTKGEVLEESPINKPAQHFLRGGRKRGRLRHESTDTDGSDTSSTLERAPPDGGYGWVVVVAAFLINMVADGVTFSFGVYYVEFSKYFKESKSATSWIGSLLASMPLLSGPVASYLADRYGCRRVTICGSLLAATGFLISSFAESMWMLYVTFGILTGIGLSLCYVAAVVIVAYYFEQRRSLATGISVCGGGIGTFIFAPLTQFLIDNYGWQHTTRILAGTFLLLSICGILMRDLEWTKKSKNSQKSNAPSMDCLPGEIMGSKPERLCSSAICIPTFVQEQERLCTAQGHQENRRPNFMPAHALSYPFSNNNSPSHPQTNSNSPKDPPVANKELPTVKVISTRVPYGAVNNPASMVNICSSPSSVATGNSNSAQQRLNNNGLPQHPTAAGIRSYVVTHTCADVGIHRHSLTYRGAVLSLKRYRLRPASSCPDIISVATTDDRNSHEWKAVVADICKLCHAVCEWKNLYNSRFLLFLLSNFLLYMWYDVLYIYLQDAALQEGYDEDKSSYLISIVGLFSVVGNLSLGYVGDKDWADSTLVYGICMFVCGVSSMLIPTLLSWSFVPLAIGCGVYGMTIAANYSLITIILVHVVSLERFTNAYGLLLLVQGIGNLVGPPIAGVIYDWTGTSSWSFMISGTGIVMSSVFILVPKIFSRCSTNRTCEDDEEADDEDDDEDEDQ